jgi:hypothetical protein
VRHVIRMVGMCVALAAPSLAAQGREVQAVSRAALLAPLAPDSGHPFPRRPWLVLDDTIAGQPITVVVHRGGDSLPGSAGYTADRAVIAAQLGGAYHVLHVIESDGYWETEAGPRGPYWNGSSFIDTAAVFRFGGRGYLRIAEGFYGTGAAVLEHVFTFDSTGRLIGVPVVDSNERFATLVRAGEYLAGGRFTVIADDRIEYQIWVYDRGDPNCCPSAGTIRARYHIVGDNGAGLRIEPDSVWREAVKTP